MRSSAWRGGRMLTSPPAPHGSSLQIPTAAEGSGEPWGHMAGAVWGHHLPHTPPVGPPSQAGRPCWPRSEGHTAAQWGQRRVRDPAGMLGLSGTLKPPAMMFWGLLSLLLFAVASGTPVGDQDEDIQVQENFEAERVMAACGPLILGAEGLGKSFISFSSRKKGNITYVHVSLCGTGVGSVALPGCRSGGASLPAPAFGTASPQQTPRQGGWSPSSWGR